jgi:hypothetical protein
MGESEEGAMRGGIERDAEDETIDARWEGGIAMRR